MNQSHMQNQVDQLHGKIKETWGRLSDDDIALVDSKRNQFFGKLQEKYGIIQSEAKKRLAELERSCRDLKR